jgi:hypothetical protein
MATTSSTEKKIAENFVSKRKERKSAESGERDFRSQLISLGKKSVKIDDGEVFITPEEYKELNRKQLHHGMVTKGVMKMKDYLKCYMMKNRIKVKFVDEAALVRRQARMTSV